MRTWIKNGLIYDGEGKAPYEAGVVIENGVIVEITRENSICADLVEDASGYAVTPGFIDAHRHCDLEVLNNPDFGNLELAQGITTVVAGNCGLAPIPAPEKRRKEIFDFIEPCLGRGTDGISMTGFGEYAQALKARKLPLSVGSYIGTGTLKAAVKGYGKSPFTDGELEEVKAYIRDGMEAGALGLSMGIMYQPECYSSRRELVEMVSAAEPYHRPLACHIRGEGDHLLSSVEEILGIAKKAGVPLTISHFKVTGVKNWGKTIGGAIERIEKARDGGQDVAVDFYPYCGGATTLISLIPPVVMEERMEDTLKKLGSRRGKEEMERELYRHHENWDNMVTSIGWDNILISSVTRMENRRYGGLTMKAASAVAGYEKPSDFLCDLLCEERGKVGVILLSMSQEDVDRVAKLPYSMVISDALYGVSDCPHPRLYGSFPRIIREYVMERGILTLEEAIGKMTLLPAKRLGLSDRGRIGKGCRGDLNILKPEEIRDPAVYGNSKQLAKGFHTVLVKGEPVIRDDKRTGVYAGDVCLFGKG